MKVLSIICQKGGTAKTTTAINLAVEAQANGLETVIIDLDPQVSAFDWKDLRGDEAPNVASVPVPHLERTLKAARDGGADLVIIDTAGRTNDAATAAARAADAILVPMQPSLVDLKTLQATLDVIRASGNEAAPVRVVLSRVKAAGTRHEDTASLLKTQHHMGVCPVMMGDRFTYQDAYGHGKGVTELDPGSKAAQEVRDLFKFTCQLLNISTSQEGESNGQGTKRHASRAA